jgi:DNA-binding GntR family transcriptional regulator
MREAYQVRAVLEELAAQLASSQIEANPEPLIAEVTAMAAAGRLQDLDRFAEHDAAFHRLIVEASGNSVLLQVWDSLASETRTRINLLQATVSLEELAQLHQPIVDALVCGDGKTAGQLLRKHFEAAQPSDVDVATEPDMGRLVEDTRVGIELAQGS